MAHVPNPPKQYRVIMYNTNALPDSQMMLLSDAEVENCKRKYGDNIMFVEVR